MPAKKTPSKINYRGPVPIMQNNAAEMAAKGGKPPKMNSINNASKRATQRRAAAKRNSPR